MVAIQKGGQVIAASIWGKLKTVTQMIAIILVFIDKFNFCEFLIRAKTEQEALSSSIQIYMNTGSYVLNIITSTLLIISVVATVFSGYDYLKNGKDLFKDA